MKFIIRDDDTNYFSKVEDIQRWYGQIFQRGIPVGFSVVPFVKKESDVRTSRDSVEGREYPIHKNDALIRYISGNPLIEVMQHGCTHETKNGIFEYRRTEGLVEETHRGKDELEGAFKTPIRVFVPPHDALYNHGVLAVESASMDIIRGTGSRNFMLRPAYARAWITMVMHRVHFPKKVSMPAYPYVVDFGKHKEAYAVRLNDDNLEFLLQALRYVARKRGNFIVTNHIFTNNDGRMRNLSVLIEEARKLGFSFTKPSELFSDEKD